MSNRIRIATIAVTLTTALLAAATAASAAPGPQANAPSADPGVDYHAVHMRLRPTQVAELRPANCSDTWGIGSGTCNGISSAEPDFGSAWTTDWSPCPGSSDCPAGAIAIKVNAGANHINGWVPHRGSADFHVTDARVPGWHPLSPITGGSTGRAGDKDGPLYLNVENGSGNRYTFDIRGYLRYKRLDRTFELSGFLDYATTDEPLENHRFHAKLEVLDTPSSPKCNQPSLSGAGGCSGSFTDDSDTPFRGEGGSIHWRQGSPTAVQMFAPSGSSLTGNIDGSSDRLKITSGNVPEWNVRTTITTGTFSGKTGEKGGPLRLSINGCCGTRSTAGRPRTRIKGEQIDAGRHRARFRFRGSGGEGDLYLACKLDDRPFKICESPQTYRHLSRGKHVFKVKVADSVGKSSRKSAKAKFRI